ncbi:MAG: TrmH family RNA methyltransferase [Ignavibacteria bacterium]|nr:TrmH family RNA methyltransferase [Ignavibacteria bacterium]
MRKLSHEEIKAMRKSLIEIKNFKRNPVYAICENIRSIYNVGAIFRTSDAALIEKLYLTGYTPHPPRKEIEKVALGATLSVPWEYRKSAIEVVNELREKRVKIFVLEITDLKRYYWELTKDDFPLAIVVGNEITGVSKELISIADSSLEIPMFGIKQSLNVAVAFGIAVYETVKISMGNGILK